MLLLLLHLLTHQHDWFSPGTSLCLTKPHSNLHVHNNIRNQCNRVDTNSTWAPHCIGDHHSGRFRGFRMKSLAFLNFQLLLRTSRLLLTNFSLALDACLTEHVQKFS